MGTCGCSCKAEDGNFWCNNANNTQKLAINTDIDGENYTTKNALANSPHFQMNSPLHSEIFSKSTDATTKRDFKIVYKFSQNSARVTENDVIEVTSFVMADNSIYNGQMKRCNEGIQLIRHGYGTIKWLDGAKYEGNWIDGKAHG